VYFLMTNDVETTSLELNRPADFMASKVRDVGLPRLLGLYSKYDVEATFFFTAHIVEILPEVVDMVKEHGHEIACHGYRHESEYSFDILPLEKQIYYLKKSKKIIEDAAGLKIYSFRAPEARINKETVIALEKTGFKYDSSVSPQRFDGPLSRGFKKKIFWMIAPRRPYLISYDSFYTEGESGVLEVPISAFIFPFIGSTMRVSPAISRILQRLLFYESKKRNVPIVFLFHPTEVIEPDYNLLKITENSYYKNIFSEGIRKKIKIKNLGIKALQLMEGILRDAKKEGAEFVSLYNFAKNFKRGDLDDVV